MSDLRFNAVIKCYDNKPIFLLRVYQYQAFKRSPNA